MFMFLLIIITASLLHVCILSKFGLIWPIFSPSIYYCCFVFISAAPGKGIYIRDQLILAFMFMMWYVLYPFYTMFSCVLQY